MKLRLTFGHTHEELFLVTAGLAGVEAREGDASFAVTTYDGEDIFLGLVASTDLGDRELFDVVYAVLMTINDPVFPQRWAEVDLDLSLIEALRLNVAGLQDTVDEEIRLPGGALCFEHIQDFVMRVPMPLLVLKGPEHRLTFINQQYVDLMRRGTADSVLGKTVREILPEMRGQPFFKLLDTVYETGNSFVGHEMKGTLRREINGVLEDAIFDFIYEPIRNQAGAVEGILVQATDVTEGVLARQVSAERESKLFRQWTELEAIYRTAPVGLCLVDAIDFRFLRANQRAAEMIGCAVEEILGQSALDLGGGLPAARAMFARAARGERQEDVELEGELVTRPGVWRSWKVSATPVFDASGRVSAITVAGTETTELKAAEARLLESEKFVAGELVSESLVRQIAGPLEQLKALLVVVRGEVVGDEALEALAVAEAKLLAITGVTSEVARRYGVILPGTEGLEVELGAER